MNLNLYIFLHWKQNASLCPSEQIKMVFSYTREEYVTGAVKLRITVNFELWIRPLVTVSDSLKVQPRFFYIYHFSETSFRVLCEIVALGGHVVSLVSTEG